MKKYKIEITETLQKVIEVNAKNEEEAYEQVKKMYKNEEIVLDSSDLNEYLIRNVLSLEDEYEKDTLIADVINYLYNDEKKHFEEFGNSKPSDHIYLKLKKLKELI